MNILLGQADWIEKSDIQKRWHFYAFMNSIHATISKYVDKPNYFWKINHVSKEDLLKEGISLSFNEAIHCVENFLNNEITIEDVY